MDRFFKKVNQKVNLGRRPMPDTQPPTRPPRHRYFRGRIFFGKNPTTDSQDIVQTWSVTSMPKPTGSTPLALGGGGGGGGGECQLTYTLFLGRLKTQRG